MVDTITGAAPRYTRSRRAEVRAAWVAARARNTLRHPVRLAAICGTVFVAALVLLVLAPRGVRRATRDVEPLSLRWRDTVPLLQGLDSTTRRLAAAESTLAARRALAAHPPVLPLPDTLSSAAQAKRDSLARTNAELTSLLDRVETSPLPQSYRALAETPSLRDDARIRSLLDSLTDVEREREEFGAGAGVDPIFVALTARATAIGRSIQAVAEARQAAVRDSLVRIRPRPVSAPAAVVVDTLASLQQRDSARAEYDSAETALERARRENAEIDRALRDARARANVTAPPVAILGAALVLGAMLGFAVALAIEIGRPRVSDLQEAERVTGTRVLAVIHPRVIPPERARRKADHRLPPLIDPTNDAYRLLASHTSITGPHRVIVTVAGDVPAVTATIAANIGAVSANEMRGTLLVDTDLEYAPVTSVLRLPRSDGVAAVLDGTADLPGVAVQTPVGRDRFLDVVPSGADHRGPIGVREAERLRNAVARAARYYELTVIASPLQRANDVRVSSSVLLCAHVAHSPVATLRAAVAELRDRGAELIGIVLWAADAPSLEPPWTFENWLTRGERDASLPASEH